MKTLSEIATFLEEHIIECGPDDGCGRCNEARECLASIKEIEQRIPSDTDGSKLAKEQFDDRNLQVAFLMGFEAFRNCMKINNKNE
jgi:hypothetical protein